MIATALHIALTLGAAALCWWGWSELNLLRGTVFFEYRYVVAMVAALLILSLAQAVAGWLAGRLTSPSEETDEA